MKVRWFNNFFSCGVYFEWKQILKHWKWGRRSLPVAIVLLCWTHYYQRATTHLRIHSKIQTNHIQNGVCFEAIDNQISGTRGGNHSPAVALLFGWSWIQTAYSLFNNGHHWRLSYYFNWIVRWRSYEHSSQPPSGSILQCHRMCTFHCDWNSQHKCIFRYLWLQQISQRYRNR